MSRSLVLGNGGSFLSFDYKGYLRDFYFHYVGFENHMHGCMSRVGIWVEGQFSWLSSTDWNTAIDYRNETLTGSIICVNDKLSLELYLHDALYNESNIYIRKVTIKNKVPRKRTISIFFHHQFHLYETTRGDTGYYDPDDNTVVHYKGRRVIVIGGIDEKQKGMEDYSVGLFGWGGHEGTWKDAEDGVLSKNPIEHGPVDSTIRFVEDVEADSASDVSLVVTFETSLARAKELYRYALTRTPEKIIETTEDYWHAWVNKNDIPFYDLSKRTIELFKKSLLIMRTHIDNNGAIIASGDSDMLQYGHDTYSYVWPRDGSYISIALDLAGYSEVSRKFFEFANEVIGADGFFYHKYLPDKSVGSSWHPWISNGVRQLPIQEDETASVLFALLQHYKTSLDLEYVENVYNSLIKKAANFMIGFRDGTTKLPSPSYDLWEMKYGISTYTSCAVYAALIATAYFAKLLGKDKDEEIYLIQANEIKEAILNYLFDLENGYFYKHIEVKDGVILHDKTVDVSSFYGLFRFNVLELDDPRLTRFHDVIVEKLTNHTKVGGIARFVDDEYYRVSTDTPGNPWFVTTLWLVDYYIAKAKSIEELSGVKKWFDWVSSYALPSGVFSEQINPLTGEQLSASPLAWSHAEFIITVIEYLKKYETLESKQP